MPPTESAAEFRRRRAVESMEAGESKAVISRLFDVTITSLNLWLRKARAGESLKSQPHKGRRRRLTDEQLVELEGLLSKGAVAYGWENNLWTSPRVREVIKDNFGEVFCRSQVWHILTDYLGWTARRPVQQSKKRDDAQIEQWKSKEFPRIQQLAEKRDAHLVFVDETGFMMTPTIRKTFAPRGCTPVNKISDPHGRISVIAAITVSPKRKRLNLHYHFLRDNTNFRGPSIVDFLKTLQHKVRGPMIVIWDSIIIHWADVVSQYLSTTQRFAIEFFPPYAPELNPVDAAWFYLKYDRLPNYTPLTINQMRCRVETEMNRVARRTDLLRSFIRRSGVPLFSGP